MALIEASVVCACLARGDLIGGDNLWRLDQPGDSREMSNGGDTVMDMIDRPNQEPVWIGNLIFHDNDVVRSTRCQECVVRLNRCAKRVVNVLQNAFGEEQFTLEAVCISRLEFGDVLPPEKHKAVEVEVVNILDKKKRQRAVQDESLNGLLVEHRPSK